MKLNTLQRYKKQSKRLGRGRASGFGKTSGRGHKGQKARTGKKLRPGFEGGQTPLFQRLPKYRGFKNPNTIEYNIINVSDLEKTTDKTIDKKSLLKDKLINKKNLPIKILGNGNLTKALTVKVEKASQSAIEKITNAGGTFNSTIKENIQNKKQEKEEKEPIAKS